MKVMNHGEYQKSLKNKTESILRFIIQDAQEAMKALPENPNNSFYADEVHYCHMELQRRKIA
jgi:hypothetical protein